MTSDDLKKAGGPRPPAERTRGKADDGWRVTP